MEMMIPKMITPITLNSRLTQATRFPFVVEPTLEIRAVVQEPIQAPRQMYTAILAVIIPFMARDWSTPIEAEELCMMQVTTNPTKIPSKGLAPRTVIARTKISES